MIVYNYKSCFSPLVSFVVVKLISLTFLAKFSTADVDGTSFVASLFLLLAVAAVDRELVPVLAKFLSAEDCLSGLGSSTLSDAECSFCIQGVRYLV